MRELIRKNRDRTPLKSLIPTQPNLSMANCNSVVVGGGFHSLARRPARGIHRSVAARKKLTRDVRSPASAG